eukprot:7082199-Prymnesium_polylepis.1
MERSLEYLSCQVATSMCAFDVPPSITSGLSSLQRCGQRQFSIFSRTVRLYTELTSNVMLQSESSSSGCRRCTCRGTSARAPTPEGTRASSSAHATGTSRWKNYPPVERASARRDVSASGRLRAGSALEGEQQTQRERSPLTLQASFEISFC